MFNAVRQTLITPLSIPRSQTVPRPEIEEYVFQLHQERLSTARCLVAGYIRQQRAISTSMDSSPNFGLSAVQLRARAEPGYRHVVRLGSRRKTARCRGFQFPPIPGSSFVVQTWSNFVHVDTMVGIPTCDRSRHVLRGFVALAISRVSTTRDRASIVPHVIMFFTSQRGRGSRRCA